MKSNRAKILKAFASTRSPHPIYIFDWFQLESLRSTGVYPKGLLFTSRIAASLEMEAIKHTKEKSRSCAPGKIFFEMLEIRNPS